MEETFSGEGAEDGLSDNSLDAKEESVDLRPSSDGPPGTSRQGLISGSEEQAVASSTPKLHVELPDDQDTFAAARPTRIGSGSDPPLGDFLSLPPVPLGSPPKPSQKSFEFSSSTSGPPISRQPIIVLPPSSPYSEGFDVCDDDAKPDNIMDITDSHGATSERFQMHQAVLIDTSSESLDSEVVHILSLTAAKLQSSTDAPIATSSTSATQSSPTFDLLKGAHRASDSSDTDTSASTGTTVSTVIKRSNADGTKSVTDNTSYRDTASIASKEDSGESEKSLNTSDEALDLTVPSGDVPQKIASGLYDLHIDYPERDPLRHAEHDLHDELRDSIASIPTESSYISFRKRSGSNPPLSPRPKKRSGSNISLSPVSPVLERPQTHAWDLKVAHGLKRSASFTDNKPIPLEANSSNTSLPAKSSSSHGLKRSASFTDAPIRLEPNNSNTSLPPKSLSSQGLKRSASFTDNEPIHLEPNNSNTSLPPKALSVEGSADSDYRFPNKRMKVAPLNNSNETETSKETDNLSLTVVKHFPADSDLATSSTSPSQSAFDLKRKRRSSDSWDIDTVSTENPNIESSNADQNQSDVTDNNSYRGAPSAAAKEDSSESEKSLDNSDEGIDMSMPPRDVPVIIASGLRDLHITSDSDSASSGEPHIHSELLQDASTFSTPRPILFRSSSGMSHSSQPNTLLLPGSSQNEATFSGASANVIRQDNPDSRGNPNERSEMPPVQFDISDNTVTLGSVNFLSPAAAAPELSSSAPVTTAFVHATDASPTLNVPQRKRRASEHVDIDASPAKIKTTPQK